MPKLTEARITHIQPRTARKTCCPGFRSLRTQQSASARRPCLQMPQGYACVAKRSFVCPSAQRPYPQVLQCHPRVAKRSSDRPSARHPCPQALQRHPHVAKRSSDRSWHGNPAYKYLRAIRVAKGVLLTVLRQRRPFPQMPRRHPAVAKRSSDRPSARQALPTDASGYALRGEAVIFGLRHSDLYPQVLSAILAWRSVLLTVLRHGTPAYRCLGGMSAWQRGHLSALRHGGPSHRCHQRHAPVTVCRSRVTLAWRRMAECLFFRFFVIPEDGDISRTCVITNDTKT